MSTGTDDGDLDRLSPAEVLARQPGPVSPPVLRATRLPALELSPEVFERLVLEYVWSAEAARDVHVYGRRGQKQYGLDIVGEDRDRQRFVYQVRRLQTITSSAIRAAVVDYAGPPRGADGGDPPTSRRFEAARFVLATAASIHDETALVDEIAALQGEYRGDLDIQVVGIEHLSVKLRDAAGIVAAFFGRDWARAFCGVEPPETPSGQATGFGLLEGPLAELSLEATAAHAGQLRDLSPSCRRGPAPRRRPEGGLRPVLAAGLRPPAPRRHPGATARIRRPYAAGRQPPAGQADRAEGRAELVRPGQRPHRDRARVARPARRSRHARPGADRHRGRTGPR